MTIIDYVDLVGRTFLLHKDNGQRITVKIVKAANECEYKLQKEYSQTKFAHSTYDDAVEEIFRHNEILDYVNSHGENEDT